MKFKFRFLSTLMCFLMTVSFILPKAVNANEVNSPFDKEYTSNFMDVKDKNIVRSVELYSNTNISVATYLEFSPTGYMIIDNISGLPIEFSEDKIVSFISTAVERVYYGGPLEYYIKDSTGYNDEFGNKCDIQTFKSKYTINLKEYFSNNAANKSHGLSSIYSDLYIPGYSLMPNYRYNPNGICGSTAAAMLIMYHDKYTNDYYVPSYLESSNGISLIEYLVPFIDGVVPGSTTSDAVNGINGYLNDQAFIGTAYWNSEYSLTKGAATILLSKESQFGGVHWVTAYGIRQYYNINPAMIISKSDTYTQVNNVPTYSTVIVIDGWGSKGVFIDRQYILGAVYMK